MQEYNNIINAFAKVYVNHYDLLNELLSSYGYYGNDAVDALEFIADMEGNEEFDRKLTILLVDYGSLQDNSNYNKFDPSLIAAAITSISTMLGQVVGQKGRTQALNKQTETAYQIALLNAINEEKRLKAQKERNTMILAGVGALVVVGVVVLLIF